ncbi:hypothetical protein H0H92_015378 [Tricholoma furcatifolium]|nr:hypothetical protein H0H92_015378 [Tricholoma furcatifolium]
MVSQCRCAAFILFTLVSFVAAKVHTYEPPLIYKRSDVFSLEAGGKQITILDQGQYDYAHFSADPGIHIKVKVLDRTPIKEMSIVASRFDYNNKPKVHKNKVSWHLNEHKYWILKIEGLRELIVAVDPIQTNVPPAIGSNIFNVATSYQADRSGNSLSTSAFNAAISAASQSARDDAVVYVPAGVYLLGNLVLPSKTSLYLAPGAVLRNTGNPNDYSVDWGKDQDGRSGTYWISTAHNSTDIKIFGRGVIDANAFTYKDSNFAQNIIVPILTSRFTLDGPILLESGSAALNIVRSNSVTVRNLKVFNDIEEIRHNGAVAIVESQNVTVKGVIAVSNADAFTAEASKPLSDKVPGYPGPLQPVKDIRLKHCLGWTGNYGFKVGQGAMSKMSNIKFSHSTVYDAAVGIGIHKKWGPAPASNVTFENIIVRDTSSSVSYLDGQVGSWLAIFIENGKHGVGPITDVLVKNVLVGGQGDTRPLIRGVDGANVSNVAIQNIWIPKAGHFATSLKELGFKHLEFTSNVTLVGAADNAAATQSPQTGNQATLG